MILFVNWPIQAYTPRWIFRSKASSRRSTWNWRPNDRIATISEAVVVYSTTSETEQGEVTSRSNGNSSESKEVRAHRRRSLHSLGIQGFSKFIEDQTGTSVLRRKSPQILQLNIGLYCNQACSHCHVESSPLRTEMMTAETAAQCLTLLANTPSIHTLDITGGAPELNASFRYLVTMARQLRPDLEIIDRCNLTVLKEPGQEDLLDFLKTNRVRIVASLPCYSESNVDEQRGRGVFEKSIAALLALNEAGYGKTSELQLDLVYNPGGAFLPPPQQQLEVQYKKQLADNFGILFNQLFTITNMPIKRFADYLHQRNELAQYMELLVNSFNPDTLESVMCRDTVSVDYDGRIFDCDFNQQLGYGIMSDGGPSAKREITVFDIHTLTTLEEYPIRVDNHCFGCTAGMGSSCQGTTI
jgi:radical SAM/Cys-rich protein